MNIEQKSLALRAERHAALGDPVRLRIADQLALGDRSPSELRSVLGVSSNLLAHHLGVLETAGLIERRRSEGDRRRSYVRLARGAFGMLGAVDADRAADGTGPAVIVRASRVVFVCTGNSARSPIAAALWRRASAVPAMSAGTKPAACTSPRAIAAAARHGLDLGVHSPRSLDGLVSDGDLVVAVCDRAHEKLCRLGTPGREGALSCASEMHWSVPNPGRVGSDTAYDEVFDELESRVAGLVPRVASA
ncbi:putative regulatory protein, ArsR family [Pseudoclavibacter endophyticus]|uniref:Helix-turn-helix domain-containing protein n=1 Tax=Pseudoclavibacter endophyticus TaxID=1778590 RepID=A0A6H9WN25_9MICO|nr:helix-turn-helix domain-containing protein [Pseudoclavibacter endophyticus]KAB1649488.1 helix-turn-helix domain-containing protein [Pseudoclavibacter endophyticus]GGA62240.1 putative regulatory protein, ArsR family [Pseudoclavibacter endophyticus]